jgi:hypothetical protein
VHRFRTITGKQGKVMRFAGSAGFDDESDPGAQAFGDQVVMDGRGGQQGRDGDVLAIDPAIRDDEDARALVHVVLGFGAQRGQAGLDALVAPGQRIADIEFGRVELVAGVGRDVAQFCHVVDVEHRLGDLETIRRIDLVDPEQVRLGANERDQRHHQLFADGVDRRIGDLREELPEVVEERFAAVREHGQRGIVAHRAGGFLSRTRHRFENELEIFLAVAERLLAVEQGRREAGLGNTVRHRQIVEL